MIHYHGTPITPRETLYELAGRNFCVSFADPRDVHVVHQIGQSVMLDNGAFTVWKQGGTPDWDAWAEWVEPWLEYPTTWAVIPDVIDASTEDENDALLRRYKGRSRGLAPVWHLNESLGRLRWLTSVYPRVCFGSSGAYREIGSDAWHRQMEMAFNAISDGAGRVHNWIHMLRGMSLAGSYYPFASVDSTDIARNHNRPENGARKMADRWDAKQCPARWTRVDKLTLEASL